MKILILTIGTRGDIEPYIGLAQALIKKDISVNIATNNIHKEHIENQKVDFISLNEDEVNSSVGELLENQGMGAVKKGLSLMFYGMRRAHDKINEIIPDYDLIIGHGWFGELEADLHNKLFIRVSTSPNLAKLEKSKISNRIKNFMSSVLLKHLIFKPYNELRVELGGKPVSIDSFNAKPLFLPIPSLLTPGHEFDKNVFQSDYWFPEYNRPFGYEMLDNFLKRKTKKLLISFGSVTWADNDFSSLATQFLNSARKFGFDVIWVGAKVDSPEIENATKEGCFIQLKAYPFQILFPQVDLVAHHCGLGTTCSIIKAGVPSVPVPHVVDQYEWAKKLYKAGIATKPLDAKKVNENTIANRLETAMKNELYKKKLAEINKRVNAQVQKEVVVNRIIEIYSKKVSGLK